MTDIVERLRGEEARMLRLFDVASDFRDKHVGTDAAADFNTMRHAVSGRDPVIEPAAAEIERLREENERLKSENTYLTARVTLEGRVSRARAALSSKTEE